MASPKGITTINVVIRLARKADGKNIIEMRIEGHRSGFNKYADYMHRICISLSHIARIKLQKTIKLQSRLSA